MLIVGHEKKEQAIARVAEFPLSIVRIDIVAKRSLCLIALHLISALVVLFTFYEAEEKLRGFSRIVMELLVALLSFYVFFGFVAIYAPSRHAGRGSFPTAHTTARMVRPSAEEAIHCLPRCPARLRATRLRRSVSAYPQGAHPPLVNPR
jgi:hypothetical protein